MLYAHMGEALKNVSEGMPITEASETYGIPYKTLHKHARKSTGNYLGFYKIYPMMTWICYVTAAILSYVYA